MPCVAGDRSIVPDKTPGPPHYTLHQCGNYGGFLHGEYGAENPLVGSYMKYICERGRTHLAVTVAGGRVNKGKSPARRTLGMIPHGNSVSDGGSGENRPKVHSASPAGIAAPNERQSDHRASVGPRTTEGSWPCRNPPENDERVEASVAAHAQTRKKNREPVSKAFAFGCDARTVGAHFDGGKRFGRPQRT